MPMPGPIPVNVLVRFAVDRAYQGRGLGAGLLRDATLRILQAAELGGIRTILVHAISDEAKPVYERLAVANRARAEPWAAEAFG
jgi:GNAT superfamily N-acetyltransferase